MKKSPKMAQHLPIFCHLAFFQFWITLWSFLLKHFFTIFRWRVAYLLRVVSKSCNFFTLFLYVGCHFSFLRIFFYRAFQFCWGMLGSCHCHVKREITRAGVQDDQHPGGWAKPRLVYVSGSQAFGLLQISQCENFLQIYKIHNKRC